MKIILTEDLGNIEEARRRSIAALREDIEAAIAAAELGSDVVVVMAFEEGGYADCRTLTLNMRSPKLLYILRHFLDDNFSALCRDVCDNQKDGKLTTVIDQEDDDD
jgi:hypothetical protein